MGRPLLSVVLAAKSDSKSIEKVINSIVNQTIKSIELIIVHNDNEADTKSKNLTCYKSDKVKIKYCHIRIRYKYPVLKTNNMLLGGIFLRKVTPPKCFDSNWEVECYKEGIKHSKGKYIMFINDSYYLKPNFVDTFISKLNQNRNVGIAICPVHNIGKYLILESPFFSKDSCIVPPKQGIETFITNSHLNSYLAVFQNKKTKHFKKYSYFNSALGKFSLTEGVMLKMFYESTMFINEQLVDVEIAKEYYDSILDLSYIVERFQFLNDRIYAYSKLSDIRWDKDYLLAIFLKAFPSLAQQCIELAKYFSVKNEKTIARTYINLAKAIDLSVDIPRELNGIADILVDE